MSKKRLFLVAFISLALALPAAATIYVLPSDEYLVDTAPLIAHVRIVSRDTGLGPFTDYQVQLLSSYKGYMPGSNVIVRVIGGTGSDGMTLWIPGAPQFNVGEEAILFMKPRNDGTYGIFQLGLGAFHKLENRGRQLAVRSLHGAQVLDQSGAQVGAAEADQVRDFGRFAQWVEERANREEPVEKAKDYLVSLPQGGLKSLSSFFTLFESGGLNLRWPEFDTGGSVTFFAHEDGQPNMTGGGFAEFQTALQAWNADPATPINLLYGGTTNMSGGLTTFDGVNAIQFDDPNNNMEDFGGPFSCTQGGVIAIGGPWLDASTTHNFNGQPFVTIQGGDVITNADAGCFLNGNNGKDGEEVFAHEIGHTLGLRHSCDDQASGACDTTDKAEALMRANAHGDGRGGQFSNDDRAGIAFLYQPVQTGPCVPSNTVLCLNNDRFRVETDWRTPDGQFGPGFNVELTPDTGYFWFFNEANVEMVIKILDACTFNDRFWVFAGGLTNVEVNITVTDTQTNAVKTYQNPLNTAFQPIQDTQAFATCP